MPPTLPTPPFDPNLMDPGAIVAIVVVSLIAAVIILWPIMRALARRLEGRTASDPSLRAEVDQIEHRLAHVDELHARVAELEERLDFAERLLTRPQDSPTPALRSDKQ